MYFEYTEEQKMIQDTARDFAENHIKPIAKQMDKDEQFPKDIWKKMGDLGFLSMTLPEEYGGSNSDTISYCILIEEVSKKSGSLGNALAGNKIGHDFLFNFGSEEHKEKYLSDVTKGEKFMAFTATEPGGGSDVAGIQTKAVKENGNYILNGNKIFVTFGELADFYVAIARTSEGKGHRGLSALLVERDNPGLIVGTKEDLMGVRGLGTSEIVYDNCAVPESNLMGEEGKGFINAMKSFDNGRILIATLALGIAQGAMEESVKYASERTAFGRTIDNYQAIQFMLADADAKIEAARLLIYKACYLKDNNLPYTREAAIAKMFASDIAQEVVTNAVQIHGGFGFSKEYDVERMFRDAKITQIFEGTNEIQRLIIFRQLLKKYVG